MDDLTKLTVEQFLDKLAERSPAPGGGAVAAAAGSLSCAMARMVAAYSVRKNTTPQAATKIEAASKRLELADQLLRALVTQDAEEYLKMSSAAKAAAQRAAEREAYMKAVLAAISVPTGIAELAYDALTAMDELKEFASQSLMSDLGVAAVLADSAAQAAWYSVRVNALELSNHSTGLKILADIDETTKQCAELRETVEAFVRDQLEG